jgi:hypothetical protein
VSPHRDDPAGRWWEVRLPWRRNYRAANESELVLKLLAELSRAGIDPGDPRQWVVIPLGRL